MKDTQSVTRIQIPNNNVQITKCWILETEEKRPVQAAEMWSYRRLLNVTWKDKKPNSEILRELERQKELYWIKVKRKLTYFGHMCRKTNSSITKTIVEGKVEGKSGREDQKYPTWTTSDNGQGCQHSQSSKPLLTESHGETSAGSRREQPTPSWTMLPKSKVKVSKSYSTDNSPLS